MPAKRDLRSRKSSLEELIELPARVRCLYPRGALNGLKPSDAQVLVALALTPRATGSELAERLALRPQSVSHALAALSDRGLVLSKVDIEDSRRRRATLTSEGRAWVEAFADAGGY